MAKKARPGSPTAQSSREIAAELGRRGGLKGGRQRAEVLSPERRKEIARQAAQARWARLKDKASKVSAPPAKKLSTPVATARATVGLGGIPVECYKLSTGAEVIGFASTAEALFEGDESRLRAFLFEHDGGRMPNGQPFHLPGEWQVNRGITVAQFIAACRGRAESASKQTLKNIVSMLAEVALEGLRRKIRSDLRQEAAIIKRRS